MEEILRSLLAFLGVGALIALIRIERTTPGENPIDRIVYWIVGGYVLLVFIGPAGAKKVLGQVVEKFDIFNISLKPKNDK